MPNQSSQPPTINTACLYEQQKDCLPTDDTFYCNPEFLEQVEQIETMAGQRIKQKKAVDFTPPSFSLGISPEKGQCASRSKHIRPTTLKFSLSPKEAGTAFIPRVYY